MGGMAAGLKMGIDPLLLIAAVLPLSQAFSTPSTAFTGLSYPTVGRSCPYRASLLLATPMVPRGNCGTINTQLQASEGEDFEITDAIREAEEKSVPFRAVRIQVYQVALAFCVVLGGVIAADESGFSSVHDVAIALPRVPGLFGSSPAQLTEAVCAVVSAVSGYFLYAEEDTKQSNLRRIAEKVAEKRREGTLGRPSGPNRVERRMAKKADKATPPAPKANEVPKEKPKKVEAQGGGGGGGGGGLLDKIKQTELFKDADNMGKAQALQLNSMLEDAGVLEPISKKNARNEPGDTKQAMDKKKGKKDKK